MTSIVNDTVRARVLRHLTTTDQALTVEQLTNLVPTGGSGLRQIQRALAELEAQGFAVRQHGQSYKGGIGWAPDTWRAR